MDGNVTQFNRRINYLIEETDAVYHEIAVRLGLSDSVMLILYALEDAGGQIPLTTIYRQTGASKQTINSALRKLETDGHILLRMADGKRKIVCLTESGKIYAARPCWASFSARSALRFCPQLQGFSAQRAKC